MANRTAALVAGAAAVMLMASFSLHSPGAVAESGDTSGSIDAIRQVRAAASAAIATAAAPVESNLAATTTEPEARAIRDAAIDEVKAIYEAAKDTMWAIVESTGGDPAVEAVYDEEQPGLKAERDATEDAIRALYDEWKFRYDAPPAEEVIADMEAELAEGLGKIENEFAHFLDDLAGASEVPEADDDMAHAYAKVEEKAQLTREDIEHKYEKRFFDSAVQEARVAILAALDDYAAATNGAIAAEYEAWMNEHFPPPPPSTTTTTGAPLPATATTTRPRPATTTTTAPATTTTTTEPVVVTTVVPTSTTSTTSTTLAVASAPDERPPMINVAYMPDLPVPVVDSALVSLDPPPAEATGEIATAGFVQRIVESKLPAGVSAVAVGPLVVLGLVIDAIRAAGGLLVIPWVILGVYMAGLLRGWRGFTELS